MVGASAPQALKPRQLLMAGGLFALFALLTLCLPVPAGAQRTPNAPPKKCEKGATLMPDGKCSNERNGEFQRPERKQVTCPEDTAPVPGEPEVCKVTAKDMEEWWNEGKGLGDKFPVCPPGWSMVPGHFKWCWQVTPEPGSFEEELQEDGRAGDGVVQGLVRGAIRTLLGGDRGLVTAPILRWLIRIPNLVGRSGPIADTARFTQAAGFALLAALVTFSIFNYWAVGITSQGNGAALIDGIVRCTGAGCFILLWPWLFKSGFAAADQLSVVLVPGAELDAMAATWFTGLTLTAVMALSGNIVPLLMVVVIGLAFVLLNLALYITKLGLTAGMLIAYMAMPLAAALWAIPVTSGPASYCARFCAAAATTPVAWALCIKGFAALVEESITWEGGGVWTDKITKILFAMAMAGVMLFIPRHVFRAWGLGVGGGGGGILGYAAMSMALGWGKQKAFGGSGGKGGDKRGGDKRDRTSKKDTPSQHKPRDKPTGDKRKPGDKRPGDKRPGDKRPGDKRPGDKRPGDKRPGDRRDGRRPGDRSPGKPTRRKEPAHAGGKPTPGAKPRSGGQPGAPAGRGGTPKPPAHGGNGGKPGAGAADRWSNGAGGPTPTHTPKGHSRLPVPPAGAPINVDTSVRSMSNPGNRITSVEAYADAWRGVHAAGYYEPTRQAVGNGGGALPGSAGDMRIIGDMARAQSSPSVSRELGSHFRTIGLATPDTRRQFNPATILQQGPGS